MQHIAKHHPESRISILKRIKFQNETKYKSFHFEYNVSDMHNMKNIKFNESENKCTITLPNKKQLEFSSPGNKYLRTTGGSNLLKDIHAADDSDNCQYLPENLKSVANEMSSLFTQLLPLLSANGQLPQWIRFNKLLAHRIVFKKSSP